MESKGVDNFLKGLISRVSDDKIADNAFSDCMNVDLSEKFLPKSVKGKIKVNSVAFDDKPCQGMTIYNNKELGSLLIVACGGYIYYSPLNTDNFQKYKIDNNGTLEDVVIVFDLSYGSELPRLIGKPKTALTLLKAQSTIQAAIDYIKNQQMQNYDLLSDEEKLLKIDNFQVMPTQEEKVLRFSFEIYNLAGKNVNIGVSI